MASMVGQRDQNQPFLVICRLPSHLFVSVKTCFISFLTREYPLQAPPHPPTPQPNFADYQFGTNVYILVLLMIIAIESNLFFVIGGKKV